MRLNRYVTMLNSYKIIPSIPDHVSTPKLVPHNWVAMTLSVVIHCVVTRVRAQVLDGCLSIGIYLNRHTIKDLYYLPFN